LHAGVVAQEVQSAFERRSLDPFAFGMLLKDENGYAMRGAEALWMEAAATRRRLERIERLLEQGALR
jgi:hypothetical protein